MYQNYVFIDESGNHDIDVSKEGATNLFVCVAVLVSGEQVNEATSQAFQISLENFSGSEIKSKGVGSNHQRRIAVLNKIREIEFAYFAVIINKARIIRDSGLQYKQSFYKFLNNFLYQKISDVGSSVKIIPDKLGSKKFQDSFKAYMGKRLMPTLLTEYDISPQDSKHVPLIQVADFLAGTLSYAYDPDKRSEYADEFINLIRNKELGSFVWPRSTYSTAVPIESMEDKVDEKIAAACLNKSAQIAAGLENSKELDEKMQSAVLYFLIRQAEESGRQLHAKDLSSYLYKIGFPNLKRQAISSRIVGPIRDAGVVLTGKNQGYRIPTSLSHILDYIEFNKGKVLPMLHRIQKAREFIKTSVDMGLDILDSYGNPVLKEVVEQCVEAEKRTQLSVND